MGEVPRNKGTKYVSNFSKYPRINVVSPTIKKRVSNINSVPNLYPQTFKVLPIQNYIHSLIHVGAYFNYHALTM